MKSLRYAVVLLLLLTSPVVAGQAKRGVPILRGVSLSNSSFVGGSGDGTVVGAIGVQTKGSAFVGTLSLTGADATDFRLSSTTLPSNLLLSGTQSAGSYSINVVATQAGAVNSPYTAPKTITGTASASITGITLSNNVFAGGSTDGTVVGAIGVTLSSGTFTSTLSLTGADAGKFKLSSTSLPSNLELNGTQAAGSYSINIVATDGSYSNSPQTQPETITGTAAPVSISAVTLSGSTYQAGAADGTVVGAVGVTLSSGTFGGTLALSDTTHFRLSSATLPSNIVLNGVGSPGPFSTSIVATQSGLSNSPYTQPETITGSTAFYVATTGNDSNPGTLASPFATLGQCRTAMRASSTKLCYVRGGTYPNVVATLSLTSSDNGETFAYYPPDGVNTAILSGGGTFAGPIFDTAGSNITIDGLNQGHVTFECIHVKNGSVGVIIRNNEFHHSTQYCVVIDGVSSGTQVTNNYVHDVGYQGIAAYQASGTFNNTTISYNAVIDTCTGASDCGGIYTGTATTTTGVVISNNYVHDNGAGGGGATIYLDDDSSNITVTGNVLAGTKFACSQLHGGSNNVYTGNICDLNGGTYGGGSTPQDIMFYQRIAGDMTGNVWENNIIIANSAGAGAGYVGNNSPPNPLTNANNSYWNYGAGGSLNHAGSGGAGSDANPTNQDPTFTCGWTYTLPGSSPVFSSPVSFPAQPAGWGAPGFWGPPGWTIPRSGTAPSPPHAC